MYAFRPHAPQRLASEWAKDRDDGDRKASTVGFCIDDCRALAGDAVSVLEKKLLMSQFQKATGVFFQFDTISLAT